MRIQSLISLVIGGKLVIALCVLSIAGAHYLFSQKWLDSIVSEDDIKQDLSVECDGTDKEQNCQNKVNAFNSNGQTGLMVQARLGRASDVEQLLKRGADATLISNDTQRTTALHLACLGLDYVAGQKTVELLLQAGARVSAKDTHGDIPLHDVLNASNSDKKAAVTKLMVDEYKANINTQNNDGNTPVHIAIMKNDLDWMTYVLEHYAPIIQFELKNNLGFTPQGLAELYGLDQLTTMIKNAISRLPKKK